MNYRVRDDCRLCEHPKLTRVLDLPSTPLANEFPKEPGLEQEEFPLWLAMCDRCGHVQLPVVVDPARLFRDYVYVSGTSPVFVEHFRRYADEFAADLLPGDLVVEIGSNDGTLLRFFKEKGMRVLGIDPAVEIGARATANGIPTWPRFFDVSVARAINTIHGKARLVVANNVFAHADDLATILTNVKKVLAEDGRFVFEVSYLGDVVEKGLFDTIYHEHLSYHSLIPLIGFLHKRGLYIHHAERVDTHGGSLRVVARQLDFLGLGQPGAVMVLSNSSVAISEHEQAHGLRDPATFAKLQSTIAERRDELVLLLSEARASGGTIAAYGAPAKATTLLRTFGIESFIDFVFDDSPLKQGRWLPGGNIPVLPSSAIIDRKPTHIVVLAWNFTDSILSKLSDFRAAGGLVIVPLPTVQVHSRV